MLVTEICMFLEVSKDDISSMIVRYMLSKISLPTFTINYNTIELNFGFLCELLMFAKNIKHISTYGCPL